MFKIKGLSIGVAALLFLASANKIMAQDKTSALERIVTVNFYNEPPKGMLDLIGRQASVIFSYSPKTLENRPPVTLDAHQQPIRMVLYNAFGQTVRLKGRGKYIIILDNRMVLQPPFGDNPQVVEGYITDPKTGNKVSNATIYDKDLMVSATTDKYGYFKVKLPYGEKTTGLQVRKAGYADTTIVPITSASSFVSLNLPSLTIAPEAHKRGILGITFPKWLLSEELWTNSINIGDTIYRSWQVSFLPYIGTNHRLSGNVVNSLSLNIIGGYSQGVKIAEIGGVVNITRKDARYFMAGGANYVGGHMVGVQIGGVYNRTQTVTGFQAAGILNQSFGKVRGVQLSGIASITPGSLQGVQISGIYSHNSNNSGLQLSGILSMSQLLHGTQISGIASYGKGTAPVGQLSGILNILKGKVKGAQLAGIANYADSVYGVQMAGIASISSKSITGAQLAGIFASANGDSVFVQLSGVAGYSKGKITGVQLSGMFNMAKGTVKGVQMTGIGNLADTVVGAQLAGIYSYSKHSPATAQLSGVCSYTQSDSTICQLSGIASRAKGAVNGLQMSGIASIASRVNGVQLSGITNIAQHVNGLQLAGVYNHADTVKGVQLAGVLNRTKLLNGFQLGLVNLADSGNGMAFGLFSYIKRGYHRLEISSEELLTTNISFRSGTKKLYNIISTGIRLNEVQHPIWSIGFGFGSSFNISPKVDFDLELHSKSIFVAQRLADKNSLYQLYFGINRSLGKRRSVALGITTNLLRYRNPALTNDRSLENAIPYTIWSKGTDNEHNSSGWIGGRISFRF